MDNRTKIRLIIADDHPVVLDGLSTMLENDPIVQVTGRASTGVETRYLVSTTRSDVILLDISLGDQSGLDICQWINEEHPNLKVLAFTVFEDPAIIDDMIHRGAQGYLFKDSSKKEIVEAIQTVHNGGLHFKGKIEKILKGSGTDQDLSMGRSLPALSRREKEVLRWIIQEHTNNEIAEKLNISPATVISHRKNMLRKLEVKNTAGLVRKAIRLKLL